MEKVYTYYQSKIEKSEDLVKKLKRQIHLLGSIRLLLVAGAVFSLWIARNEGWSVWLLIFVCFCLPFIGLMIWHTRLFTRKTYNETLATLCKNEIKALNYDFSNFDGGNEAINGIHDYTLDLDVFGTNSLFQSINRTITSAGKEVLIKWFQKPLNKKQSILNRQKAIEELSHLIDWRQDFYVTGKLQTYESDNDIKMIRQINSAFPVFQNKKVWQSLTILIPILWILLITGCIINLIPWSFCGMFFVLSFFIANLNTKKINVIYQTVNKLEKILATYAKLIKRIESNTFYSEQLTTIRQQLIIDKQPASASIKKLSRLIGGLDQRFSFMGIILNILFLRDTSLALKLETWKIQYADHLPIWIESMAQFDALSSLAGFTYNHPNYIYPEITDDYFKMEGKALGHPLMNRTQCVKNNIQIPDAPWFLIITGANMAGKSTYLRTVGTNFLLACMGTPVFAEKLTVYPAQLITSLRTTDSLISNESYFFAELKRLKMIIDRLQSGEKLFIILDEILKGTNSVDKQKGSIALMKQLLSYDTCGIIATHDLVLGKLEEEFPDYIKNYRFEASIKADELFFSYQLQDGIAQNMNACFLMKKMGITI